MADRDVTIRVNTVPGQDAMTPALQKQQQAAAELDRQLKQVQQTASQPLRAAAGAALAAAAPQMVPPEMIRSIPRAVIPPGQITPLQPPSAPQQQGELAQQIAGQTRGIITQQLLQQTQQVPNNQLAGVAGMAGAFSSLPGPLGMVASAISVVTSTVGAWIASMERARPSVAELTSEINRSTGARERIRGQGAPSAEDIWATLGSRTARRLEGLQSQGDSAGAMQLVRQEGARARQVVATLGQFDLTGERAEIEDALMQQLQRVRQGGGPQIEGMQQMAQRLGRVFERLGGVGEMPAELQNMTPETIRALTPERIRELSRGATLGRLTRAQAGMEAASAIEREGRIATMRPGAVQLSELQPLAPPRSGEVFDVQSQLQQEALRDQREQARFEAQMSLWERFLQEQQQTNQLLVGQGGGGGGIMQQFANQLGAWLGGLGGGGQQGGGGLPGWFQGIFGPG